MYSHRRTIEDNRKNCLTFKILRNAGNGDCLFLSIMQFLTYDEIHGVPSNVADLRNEIVNYISHPSNWKRFVETIKFNLESYLPMLLKNDADILKTKIYKNYMSQQYQYGTFAELQAASEIFNFVYVVFHKEKRRTEGGIHEAWYNCYSSEDRKLKSGQSKMFILFSGKSRSGHFQFMKPLFTENISQVPQGEYKTVDKYHDSDNSLILSLRKVIDTSCVCPVCGNLKKKLAK